MTRLIIIGGSGDSSVVIQIVKDINQKADSLELSGVLDDNAIPGEILFGLPVLGNLESWSVQDRSCTFISAIQKIKKMPSRCKRLIDLNIPENRWGKIVHPTACIADDVSIGYGSVVASHVTVNPGAQIGNFVSIRAGANIGHDAVLEDFCYVGPNATMCGNSRLGYGATLGPNAVVLETVYVKPFCVVGLGAAITKGFEPYSIIIGNPCRLLRKYQDGDSLDG